MHYSQLLRVLLSAALTLHTTTMTASPILTPTSMYSKRATIELYHITTATAAASIHSSGVELQVKPTMGDDFNPRGAGFFYASDDKAGILDWCKKRQVDAKTVKEKCAELITFKFDKSALTSLHVHKFGPATLSETTVNAWMHTPDFEQWYEFTAFCTHGSQGDDEVQLAADLANGGNGLDLIIGPMVGTEFDNTHLGPPRPWDILQLSPSPRWDFSKLAYVNQDNSNITYDLPGTEIDNESLTLEGKIEIRKVRWLCSAAEP
ncbi:hypothetical protein F5876DRAFT_83457 [Lentinula aff. lateritia]|uniref:Uncharacterized protein n=1 Tax=Lentinula aff. lateritia TaxID=2804960 RepID=A0ACC1THT9_9AGAR|nr:hypothetical protein F5876DRAFT_83457 [Lentinula aff. lateritia]